MDTRNTTTTLRMSQRPLAMLVATVCVAFAATLSQTATAQPAGGPGMGYHGGPGMGMGMGMMDHGGPGMGQHGRHGGKYGMGMGMDGGRQMERMLDLVKATPEQRAKIKAITETARNEMQAQREAGRALHEQGRAIFTQPTIDANAAEGLRQQMLARHDQASKRMLQMKLDIANVLTPEQRKTMAERLAQRGEMMQRHRAERAKVASAATR